MRATLPPELSATVTMDWGCNILVVGRYRSLLHRAGDAESLHLRDRARRDNRDSIARRRRVPRIMDEIFLRTHPVLLVLGVLDIAVDADDGRVGTGAPDDDAREGLRSGVLGSPGGMSSGRDRKST